MSLPKTHRKKPSCASLARKGYRNHTAFPARVKKESGAFAIMFAAVLVVLIGVGGFAVDSD